MRPLPIFALGLALATAAAATAQTPEYDPGDRSAYEAAMKCFIVATHASQDRKRAGDTDKAAIYEGKARVSFDAAVKFGKSVGRNGSQIEADILEAKDRELPKLVADVDYFRQSAGTCKALGLL